eukprot:TRINITY_DN29738_c0_g2_i1.p3 TRINITY_DN29738_c0_g2~~TRINITY_DN29738_c0_g2_i1.p3  ORF type:complete len:114 (-),score=12.14 TRINITY_DN29738_c0_g2_i1:85-426(-)
MINLIIGKGQKEEQVMSSCDNCPSKGTCTTNIEDCKGPKFLKIKPKFGQIKNVIGIISGKGGVGKSTVTGIMATILAKKGYKVGVLDADITGPSMPRVFGKKKKKKKKKKTQG